jgi:hypothetical protein
MSQSPVSAIARAEAAKRGGVSSTNPIPPRSQTNKYNESRAATKATPQKGMELRLGNDQRTQMGMNITGNNARETKTVTER